VPVVLEYAGFAANATHTHMSEFISSRPSATRTTIQAYALVGGGDAINYGSFSPCDLCYLFGAKVEGPGFDLPDGGIGPIYTFSEIFTSTRLPPKLIFVKR
jgi:hypothetical protein